MTFQKRTMGFPAFPAFVASAPSHAFPRNQISHESFVQEILAVPSKLTILSVAIILISVIAGCANNRASTAADGQAAFSSLQQAVAAAGKNVEPSLVMVKVERSSLGTGTRSGGVVNAGVGASPSYCGVIVTAAGHVLVQGIIKADEEVRITVLVGENEFVARVLKADETLGMTVIKLKSDESFVPLDIGKGAEMATGEWGVALRPTDEALNYQIMSIPSVCFGEVAGRYRRYLLNPAMGGGSLLVNLSGQVVGLSDRTGVVAMFDLHDDLQRFMAEATGAGAADEDKKKTGWFGAALEPVNKDYAKLKSLPSSALQVVHAAKRSPAAAAGVRDGDLIVAVNGKPIPFSGIRSLDYFFKALHPRVGDPFTLTVLRNNERIELKGAFTKQPERTTLQAEDLGVTVSEITDGDVFSQNLSTDSGVLVTEVKRGSPAANSGSMSQTLISSRDIIVELAGQPTPTVAQFGKALETLRRDRPPVVLVKYRRGLLTGYAGLNLALGQKGNGEKP